MSETHGRYLIIGFRRSGTTVVHLLLKGHPQVAALNDEMTLDPLFTRGLRAFTVGEHFTPAEKANGRLRLFDAVTGADANAETSFLGAKTVCGDVKGARALVQSIRDDMPGLKVILVVRSDLVAQFGSTVQLRKTGIAHSWSKGARERVPSKTKIDKLLFHRYVVNAHQTHEELRKLRQTHDFLEVSYEAFSADNDGVYRQMLDSVGLPYVAPAWLKSEKVMPKPEEYIANYAEARALMESLESALIEQRLSPSREFLVGAYKRAYDIFIRSRSSS